MKKLVVLFGIVVLCTPQAFASEEQFFGTERAAAVLNTPGTLATSAGATVNLLQPAVTQLWDARSGEWFTGTSVALWTITSDEIPLVSLRSGYALDYKVYGEAQVDVPGVARRYLPEMVKGWATKPLLDTVSSLVGKYGHMGVFAGYNFDESEATDNGIMYGLSLGARLSF